MLSIDPLHVGYVLKRYPRYSETFIVNEILAHEAAGLKIEIFALRPPSDTHFQDILARVRAPVNYLPAYGLKAVDFWAALEAASEILPNLWTELEAARGEDVRSIYHAVLLAQQTRQRGIDHLHAHFGSVATTVARLAARFAGVPFTFTAHAKDIFHESVCVQDLRRKLTAAAAVVTVSDYNLRYLTDVCSVAATRLRRVYNGLDLARFSYRAPDNRAPRILAVGRLVEKKGFSDLIDACAILAGRGRRFTCEILGQGELEPALREQIERLGLQVTVQLIGPRPQSEVIRSIQNAAAFAAPCVVGMDSNRDGLPTVLLEAMALGTPCVSTDVTGIPEVLRHEQTGLMVRQHDPDELAAALERLLTNGELRVRLAGQARSLIEKEFDVHRNAAHLRRIFQLPARVTLEAVQEAG